ncbi:hypothetical protein DMR_36690 [Solidesulfovibrio magneticus RS-1]|uniref:Uncharacterized protein n=1 Tax=Solidesulfovibrio magneticus (strain ATCC 700980 / DSM 13731 / RS-1) TaxID=573370 RepID=C4XM32_SOLM1|nr:hypothetical protein DMR_36690 [Solidesulfovibrio magneticus RS-1]
MSCSLWECTILAQYVNKKFNLKVIFGYYKSLSREHFFEKKISTIHPMVAVKSGSEARIST